MCTPMNDALTTAPTWRFRKGDSVPNWLIDLEPTTPAKQRPTITFDGDVVVVETTEGFWILPERNPTDPISIHPDDHGDDATSLLFLPNKPIHWPRSIETLLPDGPIWPIGKGCGQIK